MATLSDNRALADRIAGRGLRGTTDGEPVTFDRDIRTALDVGGENSLDAVLIDFAARLGEDHTNEAAILRWVSDLTHYERWAGAWQTGDYTIGQEIVASDGHYYARLTDGHDGAAGEPIATDARWQRLGGLSMLIARHHQYLAGIAAENAALSAKVSALLRFHEIDFASETPPDATLAIAAATAWTTRNRSEAYRHVLAGVGLDTSLIHVAWENLGVYPGFVPYRAEGASDAAGSLWIHGSNLTGALASGRIGRSTGIVRTGGSPDALNAHMEIEMSKSGTRDLLIEGALTANGASNENADGTFPADFAMTIRAWNL